MFGVMSCAGLDGFGAKKVSVEADISRGLPAFLMVGLAENSVKESRVRVQSAISNAGFDFPRARISINLAPADVQKHGTAFDLSIALAILLATGVIAKSKVKGLAAIGELSLTGEVRPVRGMLALAESISDQGIKYLLVPKENAAEAALITNLQVKIVSSFQEVVEAIVQSKIDQLPDINPASKAVLTTDGPDMVDVVGQEEARRALLIAAAGNHNMLLIGGPGSGKSMMACRLPSILPPLCYQEALTLTKIYSIAGLTISGNLIHDRPFRAPHHSTTRAGLVGGGSGIVRPGEISLASFGVLFLDELLEFPRTVLEVLRQPLENGEVTISRASQHVTFPADISLVAALNPCPCGNFGQKKGECKCSEMAILKYQSRLSGPLIDRIDLHVNVPPVDLKLMANAQGGESSSSMRDKVIKARRVQENRFKGSTTNAKMSRPEIKRLAQLSPSASAFLVRAAEKLRVSARGFDRIIRVARTIADLGEEACIHEHHLAEALQYRPSPGLVRN